MNYKMACAKPTAGFKQAPDAPAVWVRAIKFQTTPRTASRPYLVGDKRAVFTTRITITNMNVQITSMLKAYYTPTFGLRMTCSEVGIEPLM